MNREYKNGERIEIDLYSFGLKVPRNTLVTGTVIGIAARNIVNQWIVMLDEQPNYDSFTSEFSAIVCSSSLMRPEGSNEMFQWETVCR